MIAVDTSAMIAVLLDEPDASRYRDALARADRRVLSAVSMLETAMILRSRQGPTAVATLSAFLADAVIEVVPFDRGQAEAAITAFGRYGKGIDPAARLNFGDCATYALAKTLDVPLLFKGNDVTATDIVSAV